MNHEAKKSFRLPEKLTYTAVRVLIAGTLACGGNAVPLADAGEDSAVADAGESCDAAAVVFCAGNGDASDCPTKVVCPQDCPTDCVAEPLA